LVNLGDTAWESKAYKTFEAIGSPNAKAKPTATSGSLALLLKVRRCIRIAIRSEHSLVGKEVYRNPKILGPFHRIYTPQMLPLKKGAPTKNQPMVSISPSRRSGPGIHRNTYHPLDPFGLHRTKIPLDSSTFLIGAKGMPRTKNKAIPRFHQRSDPFATP
jgi:hypothetical protein